jgi:hypothetical protein
VLVTKTTSICVLGRSETSCFATLCPYGDGTSSLIPHTYCPLITYHMINGGKRECSTSVEYHTHVHMLLKTCRSYPGGTVVGCILTLIC